jgi:hypothetical protein
MGQYDVRKAQQKIVAVMARMLLVTPESVQVDERFQDMLHTDPDALLAFAAQVEVALGVVLGDSVLKSHPTIAELAAYCAQHLSAPRGEHLYVVVCQMPDGSTRERIYSAPRHEFAAKKAMDDGAAAVISVEREDAEDRAPRKSSALLKILLPLLVGLGLGVAIVMFYCWRHGYLHF